MKHYLLIYAATFIIMTLLDLIWVGGIARDFYRSRIGNLEFHALPAVLFYLMYAAGVVVFVNGAPGISLQTVAVYGALFGFFAYATYDLTNLATLKGWSPLLAVVDMAWGSFVTTAASTAGLFVARLFER